MATPTQHARTLEAISRDLDLIVFRLERDVTDAKKLAQERREIRRELERLRDHVADLASDMGF